MEFSPDKITLKDVNRNVVDFLPIKITSNKARRNTVEFLAIKITSNKFVEKTLKFVDIFFLMYRRNINIELTSIGRVGPLETQLFIVPQDPKISSNLVSKSPKK